MSKLNRIAATTLALALAFLTFTGSAIAAGKPLPTGKVNLNTASVEQLEALPGVGPKLAERIVEHRQKSGPFKTAEELIDVRGIGEKSFAKLQPYVSVGEAPARSVAR
jgi:competence protein ComEA